jgi:hypothetical protein
VKLNGQTYRAYVHGRRRGQTSKQGIPLHGIVVNGVMAVHQDALRALEPGEAPPPAQPIVDVRTSAEKAAAATPPILAEMAGKIYGFASWERLRHANLRVAKIEARLERVPIQSAETLLQGGDQSPAGAADRLPLPAGTTGNKDALVIRVDFSDLTGNPAGMTAASAQSFMDNTNAPYFLRSSYGRASMTATVTTQRYRMPHTADHYATGGDSGSFGLSNDLHNDARNAAAAHFTLSDFEVIIVFFSDLSSIANSNITYGGLGEVGGSRVWVNGDFDFRVVTHELGHTYGLHHANSWEVSDGNPISASGTSTEYGDIYDTMGNNFGNDTLTDYNPYYKHLLGWIPDAQIRTVSESGIYRISRFDNATGTGILALKIERLFSYTYWVGIRRNGVRSSTTTINDGAYVIWGDSNISDLLDMNTPGNSPNDAALAAATTFVDPEGKIAIRPLVNGGSTPNQYMDVEVDIGPRMSPVWVDFTFSGLFKDGTFENPYSTIDNGVYHVTEGGNVNIKGPRSTPGTITIYKPLVLRAVGGAVVIGR